MAVHLVSPGMVATDLLAAAVAGSPSPARAARFLNVLAEEPRTTARCPLTPRSATPALHARAPAPLGCARFRAPHRPCTDHLDGMVFQTRRLPMTSHADTVHIALSVACSVGQHPDCIRCAGVRLPSCQAHIIRATPSPSHLTGGGCMRAVNVVCSRPVSVMIAMLCFHHLPCNKPSRLFERNQLHLPFLAPPSRWGPVVQAGPRRVGGWCPACGGSQATAPTSSEPPAALY